MLQIKGLMSSRWEKDRGIFVLLMLPTGRRLLFD